MSQQRFNPDQKRVIDSILEGVPGVSERKTFGHPAYYVLGKMFAALVEDGVTLKLPDDARTTLLAQPDITTWAPDGTTVARQWIKIVLPDAERYRDYVPVIEQSVEYVLGQAR